MTVAYRPARLDDLPFAMGVVKEALNSLEIPHGFEGITGDIGTDFIEFSLANDPSGLWVAEADGHIVGYAFSWVCGDLWFLADLFVQPEWQSKGVGRMLMSRALLQAEAAGAKVRALITFAYNRSSLGLYISHGLYPRVPLYQVSVPAVKVSVQSHAALNHRPLDADLDMDALEQIDQATLGISRAIHHRYSLSEASIRGHLLSGDSGQPIGYVYVSKEGHIGPLAVVSAELSRPAFLAAVRLTKDQGVDRISAFIPGTSDHLMTLVAELGMRLGRTMVFLSSNAFGDWTRYAPRDPGFM
jgi:GNAT superfamily N-acetyltransferase